MGKFDTMMKRTAKAAKYANLRPFKYGEARAQIMGSKGGKASALTRRRRKVMRENLQLQFELIRLRDWCKSLLQDCEVLETKLQQSRSDRDKYRKKYTRLAAKMKQNGEPSNQREALPDVWEPLPDWEPEPLPDWEPLPDVWETATGIEP